MSENLDRIFVNWNVPINGYLQLLQNEVCKKYNLIPRKELHITLGYIGKANEDEIKILAAELKSALITLPQQFDVVGIGGAIVKNKKNTLVTQEKDLMADVTRVVWMGIKQSPLMSSYKQILKSGLKKAGLEPGIIDDFFYPHISLGSKRSSQEEESSFDVFNVFINKGMCFRRCPLTYLNANHFAISNAGEETKVIEMIIEF